MRNRPSVTIITLSPRILIGSPNWSSESNRVMVSRALNLNSPSIKRCVVSNRVILMTFCESGINSKERIEVMMIGIGGFGNCIGIDRLALASTISPFSWRKALKFKKSGKVKSSTLRGIPSINELPL